MNLIVNGEIFDPTTKRCITSNVEMCVSVNVPTDENDNYMCIWCDCIDYNNPYSCCRCHTPIEPHWTYTLCKYWRLNEGYI